MFWKLMRWYGVFCSFSFLMVPVFCDQVVAKLDEESCTGKRKLNIWIKNCILSQKSVWRISTTQVTCFVFLTYLWFWRIHDLFCFTALYCIPAGSLWILHSWRIVQNFDLVILHVIQDNLLRVEMLNKFV